MTYEEVKLIALQFQKECKSGNPIIKEILSCPIPQSVIDYCFQNLNPRDGFLVLCSLMTFALMVRATLEEIIKEPEYWEFSKN